jgi:hypothetical protein
MTRDVLSIDSHGTRAKNTISLDVLLTTEEEKVDTNLVICISRRLPCYTRSGSSQAPILNNQALKPASET